MRAGGGVVDPAQDRHAPARGGMRERTLGHCPLAWRGKAVSSADRMRGERWRVVPAYITAGTRRRLSGRAARRAARGSGRDVGAAARLPRPSRGERGVARAPAVAALPRAARTACVAPPEYGPAAVPHPLAWPRGRSAAPDAGRPGCSSGGRRWPDRACRRGRPRSPRCGGAAGGQSRRSPGRWCSPHGSGRPPSPSSGGEGVGDGCPVAGRAGARRRVSARDDGPALRGPRARPGTRESPRPHALGTAALEAVRVRARGAGRGLVRLSG